MPDQQHALVTGALGVIGGGVVDHLATLDDWTVTSLARRPAPDGRADQHLELDLLDREKLAGAADAVQGVTHLVFAAYAESGEAAKDIEVNTGMLEGALDLLQQAGAPLRHVTLYQGGKAYGAHLGAYRTPARETDPRLPIAHFYYTQEDLLRERAPRDGFTFSILRPDIVLGTSRRSPMNLAQSLAAFALVNRELGLPLRFPGTAEATDVLVNTTDAGLLAEATVWAGTSDAAAGGTFNVVNGDLFRWPQLFERVAGYFGMESDVPQPVPLSENMPPLAPVWERLTEREGLDAPAFDDLGGWDFLDFLFSAKTDGILDTVALHQAGFHGVRRTEDALFAVFDRLRAQGVIPRT
ncbi:MAG TPA: SDR family oxidoreductase [Solirubrobacteraceae bacterium]|nr:SDR family oxidoreductase [Solirubrobacteraceae bacterium]